MKRKSWSTYVLATLIIAIGLGGQVAWSLYIEPTVFSKEVVKIKADREGIPEYTELTPDLLYVDNVPSKDVPRGAFTSVDQLAGRSNLVVLRDGMILTDSLVDLNALQPLTGESFVSLPKDAIYAINGTLRAKDLVDIMLVSPLQQSMDVQLDQIPGVFMNGIKVAFVRTEDNNDVNDTPEGKSTNRQTSTGRVSYPELVMNNEQRTELKQKIEEGYKLWVVRVR